MMNYKPFPYTLIGLLTGGAVTSLAVLLTLKPFSQVSQAHPNPSPTAPSSQAVPGMRGMMGQSDQHFIVMMIPHHEGAISMADLALQRAQRPEIRTLAQSIKDTQSREIQQMQTWYRQWYNADVPQWTPGMGMYGWNANGSPWTNQGSSSQAGNWTPGMGMHPNWGRNGQWNAQSSWQSGMGCMGMRTMLGNTTALQNATDFDRAFIEQMIPHHQMGVMMAQMVLAHSNRPEIRELAQRIIDTQTTEINQMQQWYQSWYQ